MSLYGNYPNIELCNRLGCYITLRNMNTGGCPGCNASEKQKAREKETAYNEAKKLAIENKKVYVLYDDSEGRRQFMEFEAAKATGISPVGFVSYL